MHKYLQAKYDTYLPKSPSSFAIVPSWIRGLGREVDIHNGSIIIDITHHASLTRRQIKRLIYKWQRRHRITAAHYNHHLKAEKHVPGNKTDHSQRIPKQMVINEPSMHQENLLATAGLAILWGLPVFRRIRAIPDNSVVSGGMRSTVDLSSCMQIAPRYPPYSRNHHYTCGMDG